jgi:hypothetical protein
MTGHKTFGINSSLELLQKLGRDIAEARQTPATDTTASGDRYWNCAVTAWHVTDWLFREIQHTVPRNVDGQRIHDLGSFQNYVRSRSDALRRCYQFATTGKHGPGIRRDDPNLQSDYSVVGSTTEYKIGDITSTNKRHKIDDSGVRIAPVDMFDDALQDLLQIRSDLKGLGK